MRAKSTTALAREHEKDVVSTFEWANARRSPSSGANFNDPIDVVADVCIIECEATEKKSYTLKLDFWEEIISKQFDGKVPLLAIRFRDPTSGKSVDLGISELNDLSALLEELEAYRDEAITR